MTVTSDCANASQVQRDDRTALEQAVPPRKLWVSRGLAGPAASLVLWVPGENCSSLGLEHLLSCCSKLVFSLSSSIYFASQVNLQVESSRSDRRNPATYVGLQLIFPQEVLQDIKKKKKGRWARSSCHQCFQGAERSDLLLLCSGMLKFSDTTETKKQKHCP